MKNKKLYQNLKVIKNEFLSIEEQNNLDSELSYLVNTKKNKEQDEGNKIISKPE